MRYYSANVNIGGDRNHVVVKRQLTPAHLQILQAIHGRGEVHGIAPEASSGIDRTPQEQIKTALDREFGRVRVGASGDSRPVLLAVFPGWPNVKLPADAESAGIDEVLMAEEAKPRGKAARGKKAAEPEPEVPEEPSDFTE